MKFVNVDLLFPWLLNKQPIFKDSINIKQDYFKQNHFLNMYEVYNLMNHNSYVLMIILFDIIPSTKIYWSFVDYINLFFFVVCQAMIKKYSIERHNNYTGSLEDLHTSKGVTFFGDYRVSIDMFLTEESKNVASISFTVHKTSDVMVTTVEGRDFRGLAVRFFKIIWLDVMFIYIVS